MTNGHFLTTQEYSDRGPGQDNTVPGHWSLVDSALVAQFRALEGTSQMALHR